MPRLQKKKLTEKQCKDFKIATMNIFKDFKVAMNKCLNEDHGNS